MTTGVVPVRWTAPEGLSGQKFSSASDVWSFGITCVEIIQDGLVPYAAVRSNPALIALVTGGGVHPRPDGCSDAVYAVLIKCWSFDPLDRPGFGELRDFFQSATPAALLAAPAGGVFLEGGARNQYTTLEGGGGEYAVRHPPPVPHGSLVRDGTTWNRQSLHPDHQPISAGAAHPRTPNHAQRHGYGQAVPAGENTDEANATTPATHVVNGWDQKHALAAREASFGAVPTHATGAQLGVGRDSGGDGGGGSDVEVFDGFGDDSNMATGTSLGLSF